KRNAGSEALCREAANRGAIRGREAANRSGSAATGGARGSVVVDDVPDSQHPLISPLWRSALVLSKRIRGESEAPSAATSERQRVNCGEGALWVLPPLPLAGP